MIKKMIGALLACAIALPAWSVDRDWTKPFYAGLSLTGALYRDDRPNRPDFNMAGGTLKLGYSIIPWFALEAHAGTTAEDTARSNGDRVQMRLDWYASLYGRFNIPVTERIRPYLLLGYTRAQTNFNERSGSIFSGHNEANDFSYGGGIELYSARYSNTALYAEFIRAIDHKDFRIDIASLGIVHRF